MRPLQSGGWRVGGKTTMNKFPGEIYDARKRGPRNGRRCDAPRRTGSQDDRTGLLRSRDCAAEWAREGSETRMCDTQGRGKRPSNRARLGKLVGIASLAAAAVGALPAAASDWGQINLPRGVTNVSTRIYALHMMAFWVCVCIGAVVFGVMIWSLIFHRKSRGAVPDVTLVHSTKVEVIWTAIPVLILVGMAIPAARLLVRINNNTDSQLSIRVNGFQWGWQYKYLGTNVSIISKLSMRSDAARMLDSGINVNSVPNYLLSVDHQLVVPVGEKIRLLITSVDVVHSWWVPDLGVKKDAIPGFINQASFIVNPSKPGVYRGQCTELCGRDHAFMPIVVRAVTPAVFQAWLKRKEAARQQASAHASSSTSAAVST